MGGLLGLLQGVRKQERQVALHHGIGVDAEPCVHHVGCRLPGRGRHPDETRLPSQGQVPERFSQLGN